MRTRKACLPAMYPVWSFLRWLRLRRQDCRCAEASAIWSYPRTEAAFAPQAHGSSSLVTNPSKPLFSYEKDHRYFEIFYTKTAFEILLCYDAGTFRQTLLQACVSDPSLRHVVIALGALDVKMETLQEFKSLSLEDKEKSSHQHHLNALEEYSKAISKMRVSIPSGFLCCMSTTWQASICIIIRYIER